MRYTLPPLYAPLHPPPPPRKVSVLENESEIKA